MKFSGKRFVNSMLLVTFLGAMACNTGCGSIAKGSVLSGTEVEEVAGVMDYLFLTQEHQIVVDNCQDAVEQILSQGTKAFFQGYSVDESFLWWFASNYGENELIALGNTEFSKQSDASAWYTVSGCTMHALWAEYCRDMSFDTDSLTNVTFRDTEEDGTVTMDFVGDVCLAEDWYTTDTIDASSNGIFSAISMSVLNELNGADLTIANNEFVISDQGEAIAGKDYIFCADSTRAQLLQVMGIDLASLANNHVYDHGEIGLLDTMENLKAQGIAYVGAGKNLNEAMQAQYFVVAGRKIGFVAATQIERYTNFTKQATDSTAGVLKTKDSTLMCQAIRKAKENCDLVIVLPHWGTESYITEESSQVALAKDFIEAGADLIIGSHPHRLEGVEYIEGVPVVYSLGNFLLSNGDLYTSIAQVTLDSNNKFHLELLPCEQKDCKVSLIEDATEINLFNKYIADVSNDIGILSDGEIFDTKKGANNWNYFAYRSGQSYKKWDGDLDLQGRTIDIVGNLK